MKDQPPENSMVQVNANYEKWKDARDVDKAFDQFVKDRIIWWNGLTPNRLKAVVKDMKAFAKSYAKRCGVMFTEQKNEKQCPEGHGKMKKTNEKNQEWRDARDVYKALSDFLMDKNRTLPMHDADWIDFARYYAQRCVVDVDGECEHPYHSVVGGGGKPERCLKCGRVLSE
jgi:hypothetical protein